MQEVKEFVLATIAELLWPSAGVCQNDEMNKNSLSLKSANIQIFLIRKGVKILSYFSKLCFSGLCMPPAAHHFNKYLANFKI